MSTLTASAVLLMLPRHARTPVAVLVGGEVPSSLRLDIFDAKDTFVRLRKGPGAHGLPEPYRQVSWDEFPAESAAAIAVSPQTFAQARFASSASLFGAVDAIAFVPWTQSGEAYERVRVPIPSLDQASWHEYELAAQSRTECRYRVATTPAFVGGGVDALSAV